ncbi:carbohydrate ABC transporter permease [Streptomyces sp. MP131-18]|uniref:carbohydrate ABC transporter permease n=1 Tax=Streptomyces sp. MP131-18 TaxID=1857892 RepID=UPI0009A23E72|nr:carbohydrate ABC transporter permease [Streptomyces sp. MP131-18]ONK13992.1 L-arabinose transport system permease protein AraQ [Streptomyces sp. MP131-18]
MSAATPTPAAARPGEAPRTPAPVENRPRRRGSRTGRVALYVTLTALLLVFVAPMVWAVSGSFKPRGDIFEYPPNLIPSPGTFENFRNLLSGQPFWNWFAISVVTALLATAIAVFVCALAGFAFAKYRFAGKRLLFSVMFSSLSVPFAVILVPLFVLIVKSGLSNPWFALIVPWVAPAFGIFMMQQYIIQSIPDEILEAARIDGASEFGIFWRVVLPLLRPPLGALAVWQFLQSYNSFLWPLVLISDTDRYTIPLGLNILFKAENRSFDLVLPGAVLASVPTILVFLLLRKQLLEGLSAGAVKG